MGEDNLHSIRAFFVRTLANHASLNHQCRRFFSNGTAADVFDKNREKYHLLARYIFDIQIINHASQLGLFHNLLAKYSRILATILCIPDIEEVKHGLWTFGGVLNQGAPPFRINDDNLPITHHEAKIIFEPYGEQFYQEQFAFCPITLKRSNMIQYTGHRNNCPLPYLEHQLLAPGISRVELEKHQLTCTDGSSYNSKPVCIVVKELNDEAIKLDKVAWEGNLDRLLSKRDKSIIDLVATLQSGGAYSLLFEPASCNLSDYLFGLKGRTPDDAAGRYRTFINAVSMAGALAFLHKELEEMTKHSNYSFYYLDLNPRSILIFDTNRENETWKMTDFRVSRIRGIDTRAESTQYLERLGNPTSPKKPEPFKRPGSDETYHAPEVSAPEYSVTWESDIWSYGCILGLVISHLVRGPRGARTFRNILWLSARERRTIRLRKWFLSHTIGEWFSELERYINNALSQWDMDVLCEALRYTRETILRIEPKQRPYAAKIEQQLVEIGKNLVKPQPVMPLSTDSGYASDPRADNIENRVSPMQEPIPRPASGYKNVFAQLSPRKSPSAVQSTSEISELEDAQIQGMKGNITVAQTKDAQKLSNSTIERHSSSSIVDFHTMKDMKTTITDWFLFSRGVSSMRSSATIKVVYRIKWDPFQFFQSQGYNEEPADAIVGVITLTGSAEKSQALTCSQYMRQTWPSSGPQVLQLTQDTLRLKPNHEHSCTLSDGTRLYSCIHSSSDSQASYYTVTAMGPFESVVEIGQQYAWLSAALHPSPFESGLAFSRAFIKNIGQTEYDTFPITESMLPGDTLCEMDIGIYKGVQNPAIPNGKCWYNLFRNPVVAEGFPISKRQPIHDGLEIPLHMMAVLLQTRQAEDFSGRVVLKGFSQMLIQAECHQDVVLWHSICNEAGNRISYADSTSFARVDSGVFELGTARHIIGWCSDVKVMAGARDAKYDFANSRLPRATENCMLRDISLSGGRIISGGEKVNIGYKDTPAHAVRNGYIQRLKWVSKRLLVLWDEEDKRGWLINGMTALLHLVRASLNQDSQDEFSSAFMLDMAEIRESARPYKSQSAAAVLINKENMGLKIYPDGSDSIVLGDRVQHLHGLLEKIIDYQLWASQHEWTSIESVFPHHLEGWDAKDLISDRDPIYPREAMLREGGEPWAGFARSVNAVTLFGRGFGDIMQPSSSAFCPEWIKVPKGMYYLAAPVSDLIEVMEAYGDSHSIPIKLTGAINWHNSANALGMCPCLKGDLVHTHPVQVLAPSDMDVQPVDDKPTPLVADGAVIFGYNETFQLSVEVDRSHRQGKPLNRIMSLADSGIGESLGSSMGTRSRESSTRGDSANTFSPVRVPAPPSSSSGSPISECDLVTAKDYNVGIVCALPIELRAVRALFDARGPDLEIPDSDPNHYALGCIGKHRVAAACLPDGGYGTNSAADVASNMRRSFPALEFCLMVGIGGGVYSERHDIRLGDVVISKPTHTNSGVLQYDMGKTLQYGDFQLNGSLCPPPRRLMTAISELRSDPGLPDYPLEGYLDTICIAKGQHRYPGFAQDKLFSSDYAHDSTGGCDKCDPAYLIHRDLRESSHPYFHYGLIASGNQVMKDSKTRDELGKKHDILCFEMEAAGIMNTMPCLVIRGICDYADSHKTKEWQGYAAATAAAFAKLLLTRVRSVNS
ncbi:hypothetical protein AWENTII_008968 [Aspergillus wentii]